MGGHGAFAFFGLSLSTVVGGLLLFFIFYFPHLVVFMRSQGLENGEKMENNSK